MINYMCFKENICAIKINDQVAIWKTKLLK